MHTVQRVPKPSYRADIIVYDPEERRVELIVEVKNDAYTDILADSFTLREAMLWVGCHHGILVTPQDMYILEDTFKDTTPEAIVLVNKTPLSTPRVLEQFIAGRDLHNITELRIIVADWLEALSKNWFQTLPADVVDAFLPEIVACVSEGKVRLFEEIRYV